MTYLPHSKLFKKYIGSYILVFSIPFIAFLFVINYMYISRVRNELVVANESYLEHSNSVLDNQLYEVRSLGNYINQTNEFNRFAPYESENFNSLRTAIRQHEHSASSVNAVYVIYRNSSFVFSSRGNMTTQAMMDFSTHFSDIQETDQLNEIIDDTEEKVYIFNNRLYYTMPLGGRGLNYGAILMVMNTNAIQSNIDLLYDRNVGMSFLTDPEGEVVLSSTKYSKLIPDELREAIPEILTSEEINLSGTTYMTNNVTNELSGLSFVSLTDTQEFYKPLYRVLFLSFLGALALIFLGLIISYYFATKTYQPVRKIISAFEKERDDQVDEWAFIQTNINQTHSEVESLSNLVDEHTPIIRNAALLDLIEGRYEKTDPFKKRLDEYGITFPYTYFAMMVIELGHSNIAAHEIRAIDKMSYELNTQLSNDAYRFEATVPHLRNNQIFLIVNFRHNKERCWNKIIDTTMNYLVTSTKATSAVIKVGIGVTYDSWDKIKNSYIEASSALDKINKNNVKDNTILFFRDIKESNPAQDLVSFEYPEENSMLLVQSLKQGNKKIAREQVMDIFQGLKEKEIPPVALQAITAFIFNTVLQSAKEWGLTEKSQMLFRLQNFEDLVVAQQVMEELVQSICIDIHQQMEDESSKIGHNIVEFIFENYYSPDIALEQLASQYDISISYASKLIKEETGESFTNIVQSLRMNRFKELLVSTSSPIKDLVVEVGYYDVSNFTRKFRKENDMTPGQYRKKFKNSPLSSTPV